MSGPERLVVPVTAVLGGLHPGSTPKIGKGRPPHRDHPAADDTDQPPQRPRQACRRPTRASALMLILRADGAREAPPSGPALGGNPSPPRWISAMPGYSTGGTRRGVDATDTRSGCAGHDHPERAG